MLVRLILLSGILFICSGLRAQESAVTFKVMAWNILHGANDIDRGVDQAIGIIAAVNPDVILMVETYGSGKKIADSLGYHFHLIAREGIPLDDPSVNLSIYSRFPFGDRIDTEQPFYLGGREIWIGDQKVRLFSNWFYYLPWEDEPQLMGLTAEELLAWEREGKRYEMIQEVLPYLTKYTAQTDSIPMVFGGDMNSPSHLDWAEGSTPIHNGLVVPWYATRVLDDMGLTDSYRQMHPDPLTHPGITWNAQGKKDEHRIDYIFYKGNNLKAIASETHQAFFNTPITLYGSEFTYPSDHGFVVTTFQIR